MKTPCKKFCGLDYICYKAEECDSWKNYVFKSKAEREEIMKCPKCYKEMIKKQATKNVFYFECPQCHHEIGKPKEVEVNG